MVAGDQPSFGEDPHGWVGVVEEASGHLAQEVGDHERGVYLSVQHTFGGISRVAFPLLAGLVIQYGGVGVPFWMAGVFLLAALPLTGVAVPAVPSRQAQPSRARRTSALDFTGEFTLTGEFKVRTA